MTGVAVAGARSRSADEALASAVVRIRRLDGTVCGAGALVAPDPVLTYAHGVSDALGRPRHDPVPGPVEGLGPVPGPVGDTVTVDLPLAAPAVAGAGPWPAEAWVAIRPDRTGDIAVLRLREPVPGARPLPVADPAELWEHGARAAGFTGGEPGELWFRGRFSGPMAEGWIQLSRADGEGSYVKRGFSGSPVWDNELGAVVGLLVAAQPEREAQQAFMLPTGTLLRELPELASVLLPATPFRGLSALPEHDADVFFGRGDDVDKVLAALLGAHPAVTALAEEVRASADFLAGRAEVRHDLERWQQADASPPCCPADGSSRPSRPGCAVSRRI
ncbi:serine protease [Streptomyces sp. NPDC032472]|uniref:S1 family peptidase n=1 Tax=Streptomyces sp. NPDC032472 TaxID=3155018 RepID=UPI0033D0F075